MHVQPREHTIVGGCGGGCGEGVPARLVGVSQDSGRGGEGDAGHARRHFGQRKLHRGLELVAEARRHALETGRQRSGQPEPAQVRQLSSSHVSRNYQTSLPHS